MSDIAGLNHKDRFLRDVFDLTGPRVAKLAKAIWQSAEQHDFTQLSVGTIHGHHHATQRAEAIAALVGCSTRTGDRINKSETHHAETWPLLLAGILPFLTLAGAVAFVAAATGIADADAEALIRRHTGPEKQS